MNNINNVIKPPSPSSDEKKNESIQHGQTRIMVLSKSLFTTNRLLYCTAEELNINTKINLIGGVIDQWSPPTKNLFNNVSDFLFHKYLQGYFENIYYKHDFHKQSLKPSKTFLSITKPHNTPKGPSNFSNTKNNDGYSFKSSVGSTVNNRNNFKPFNGKSTTKNEVNQIAGHDDFIIKTIPPEPFQISSVDLKVHNSRKFLSRKKQHLMVSNLSPTFSSLSTANFTINDRTLPFNNIRTSTLQQDFLPNFNQGAGNNFDNSSTVDRGISNSIKFFSAKQNANNFDSSNIKNDKKQKNSEYKPGELISVQKMLVQVNLIDETTLLGAASANTSAYMTENNHNLNNSLNNKNVIQTNYKLYHSGNASVNNKIYTDASLFDARIRDRWKEYYVVIRSSHNNANPDTPFTFEFLKDRYVKRFSSPSNTPPATPASSLGASNIFRSSNLDFELSLSKCSVNFYNYLDKSICISVPESSKEHHFTSNSQNKKFIRLYIFKSISIVESIDWYLFLKSYYVSLNTKIINVFIPSLELDLTIEVPLEAYEHLLNQNKKRKEFVLEFANNNYNYKVSTPTNYIIHKVLERLKEIQQNFPTIENWFKNIINNNSTKIGLAWKYFDRLEWIIDINQNLVSQFFALDFNCLVLEIVSNYPTTVHEKCQTYKFNIYDNFCGAINNNNTTPQQNKLNDNPVCNETDVGNDEILKEPTPIEGFLKIVPEKTPYGCFSALHCGTDDNTGDSFKYFFTSRDLFFFMNIKNCSPPILRKYDKSMKLSNLQSVRKSKSLGNLKLTSNFENTCYQPQNTVSNLKIPDNYIQSLFELTPSGEIEWLNNDHDLKYHDDLTVAEIKRQTYNIYKAEGILKFSDIIKINSIEGEPKFRIELKTGSQIILETKSFETRNLWVENLKQLKRYWKLRNEEDLQRLISCRESNLKKINIKESEEVNFVDNSSKWELKKGLSDPKIYNINHITLLKVIIKSGELYRKLRKHGNFEKYYVVLIPGYLLIYEIFERGIFENESHTNSYYKRSMKIPLRNCYLYSGNSTNQDLLQKDRNFDIQNPGNHILPKIYADGWKSSEDEASRCFTLWIGAKRLIVNRNYYSEKNIKPSTVPKSSHVSSSNPENSSNKSTIVRLVNRLGREGTNIIFMARSRQEKDLWALNILNEIGRFNYMTNNEVTVMENV